MMESIRTLFSLESVSNFSTVKILLSGLLIVSARCLDVTFTTIRTISVVYGRTKTAFVCAFLESAIWLSVMAIVLPLAQEMPILGFYFAMGFALGNVVGIKAEGLLAMGFLAIRIISKNHWVTMAEELRKKGFGVTTFIGEGVSGPVGELSLICRRRDAKKILNIIKAIDSNVFYYTETAGTVNRNCRPYMILPNK